MNKNKKIALITGAGNGIGAATAIELSKNNMHVIISDKSLSSLTNTENTIIENGGTCTVVELDMKDFLGIDRLGIEIFKRWKKLDVLISNAAILGTLGPIYHQSNDEFLDVMNVNLISNHRLIRSFDSLLKNSASPKAFFLTSSVAKKVIPFWGAYAVSKASLEHLVKIWSEENKQNNLSISIINPGKTNTKMRKQAMPGEDKSHLQNPNEVAKLIVKKVIADEVFKGNIIEIDGLNN